MNPSKRHWLTIAEAADHFAISRKTLYSLIGRDRLPAGSVLKIGRQIRINAVAIEEGAEGQQK